MSIISIPSNQEIKWEESNGFLSIPSELTWTSDEHLRSVVMHQSFPSWEPTGIGSWGESWFRESLDKGIYTYTFNPIGKNLCGELQFDLENTAGGFGAGGYGSYLVLNTGILCNEGDISKKEEINPIPESSSLLLIAIGFAYLIRRVTRK